VFLANRIDSPDEVTESQNQNANTGELHGARKVRLEFRDVSGKHGRESEGTEALCKCDLYYTC
jgi:hypothetical protein